MWKQAQEGEFQHLLNFPKNSDLTNLVPYFTFTVCFDHKLGQFSFPEDGL